MENTLTSSQNSLFWDKLGKWQAMLVSMTLAAYFVTWYFTGDRAIALFAAFMIGFLATAFDGAFPIAVATFIAWFSNVIVTKAYSPIFSPGDPTIMVVIFYIIFCLLLIVLVALVATEAIKQAKKMGVSERIAWLSFVMEFIVILPPLLLVH